MVGWSVLAAVTLFAARVPQTGFHLFLFLSLRLGRWSMWSEAEVLTPGKTITTTENKKVPQHLEKKDIIKETSTPESPFGCHCSKIAPPCKKHSCPRSPNFRANSLICFSSSSALGRVITFQFQKSLQPSQGVFLIQQPPPFPPVGIVTVLLTPTEMPWSLCNSSPFLRTASLMAVAAMQREKKANVMRYERWGPPAANSFPQQF